MISVAELSDVHLMFPQMVVNFTRYFLQSTSLCCDPLISKIFSRNKFEVYLSFLHVVDEDTEKELNSQSDKLCKICPLNDHLQRHCQDLYQPHREISIDERMVRSKARFSYRQYICNKPKQTKWGSNCGAYVILIIGTHHTSLFTLERMET